MSQLPTLLTAGEVAEALNVSVLSIYRWAGMNPPVLPSVNIEGTRRFRPEDVEALIARSYNVNEAAS